jgi:ABC-2 type transport system ATP-binding protein
LCAFFELNPRIKIKKMSKGMKQKLAIIGAFFHNPEIYILDEPTSGLDPIMQAKFCDLILAEKSRGKTILMSSHSFEEIERVADSVVIIKQGRIAANAAVGALKARQKKIFVIESPDIPKIIKNIKYEAKQISESSCEFVVPADQIDAFVKAISRFRVDGLHAKEVSLETVFWDFYQPEAGRGIGAVTDKVRVSNGGAK